MGPESGKKIIILYILNILRKYTDVNHTMTQQQVADQLRNDYGIEVNRSTIKRNLTDLIECNGIMFAAKPAHGHLHINILLLFPFRDA